MTDIFNAALPVLTDWRLLGAALATASGRRSRFGLILGGFLGGTRCGRHSGAL
jgi:hypothetical protein